MTSVQTAFQVTINPCQVQNIDATVLSFGLSDLIYTQYDPSLSITISQKVFCANTQLIVVSDPATNTLD